MPRSAGQIRATPGIGIGVGVAIAIGIDDDIMSQPMPMRRPQIYQEFDADCDPDAEGCSVGLSAFCHFNQTPEQRDF